ncbi:hypothetical protein LOC67_11380 [Stieleria sp. JC731]|uniref:hypothetical protein n=1 Tax=Pirellulaceae TaxID=2691357 RepID=UPI001E5FD41A|nr:hypothetical protein [Stieleria sp. JC731]MCC9601147.1 hypothetical protein [Stieleria sp. JC731]
MPASPIVSVQNPTIEESKRLVEWLVDSRIRLSTADSDPSQRALKLTIGRDGNITATMGDLFRHADRVWVLGNPETCYPRLQEKLDGAQTPVIHSQKIEASILSSMLAAASGANDLSAPYADLFGHDYLGIIVTENAFASGEEVVCSDLLSQLIAKLNAPFSERRMRRAVLVRLNYEENLSAVLRWTTNQSLDRYSTDLPAHIRLGSPKPTDRPSQTAVRLQIGGRDLGPEFAEHFVPAAQAGVHIAATTTRADGSVTLPLLQWKETKLPTRIALLRQMIESQAKH